MTLIRIRVSHITLAVIVIAFSILSAAAHMAVTCWVGVGTVWTSQTVVSTTRFTFAIITIVTEVSVVRSGNVANTVNMFAVGISAALRVGAGSIW